MVESRQDVVPVLLVSGGDAIFHQKLPVAESIVRRIWVVHDVRRNGENELNTFGRDDFETLAHAVVVLGYAAIVRLPLNIAAKFLL